VKRGLVIVGCAMTLALAASRFAPFVSAASYVEVTVKDDGGKPISDAVVALAPAGGATSAPRPASAIMDQQFRMFVPYVLAVPVGTPVTFPNRDNIRHHVYSFSAAKRFELPLYMGTPAAPVLFDRPGVVVLGCNIHDWMVGYIYVSPTSHFAKTADRGVVRLPEVSAGAYEASVWHPRLRSDGISKPITVTESDPLKLEFVLALKPDRRMYPPPLHYERPQS